MLFTLLSAVRSVHVECAKSIRTEGGVGRGLVKDEKGNATRVGLLEDADGKLNLFEELFVIPPWVAIRAWIDDLASISSDVAMLVTDNETAILLLNEVGYVN